MPPVATVTGWGRIGPEETDPMSRQLLVTQVRATSRHDSLLTLSHLKVPLLSGRECEAQPGSSVPQPDQVCSVVSTSLSLDTQVCAGLSHAVTTACPGDSGGGLVTR